MAKDTGKGSRIGAVTARTQSKNPKTGDWTKRDETPDSPKKGQFMDVKSDGKKFKGVAKEPDKRRQIKKSAEATPKKFKSAAKKGSGSNTTGAKIRK